MHEQRMAENNVSRDFILPEYTTDVFDHAREEAENSMNEKLEKMMEDEKDQVCPHHVRLPSNDINLEDDEEDAFYAPCSPVWNPLSNSSSPPKTLLELFQRIKS